MSGPARTDPAAFPAPGASPGIAPESAPDTAQDPGPAVAVSVVMPAWNAAATIAAAIGSVRAQTRGDWELLLVDDGSTDATRAIAAAIAAEEPRLRLFGWAERRGAAAARNQGIRAAGGRIIAFLDADDLWRPEKLARQVGYMEATGAPFTFASVRRIDAEGRPLGIIPAPARVDYAGLLRGNVIPCQTAAYDRLHYGRVEMPPLPRRQDYGLWLTLLARGGEAHGLPEALADWRMRPGSLSSNKLVAAGGTWRVYREVAGLGPFAAAWRLSGNLARGALKRLG